MSLITALAPLGAKHQLAFTLAYSEDQATVTVTAIVKPNEGTKGEPRHIQFVGPLADVEKEIAEKLPAGALAIASHANTLADIEAQLKKEEQEARDKAKPKPAAPAEKKSEPAKPAAAGKAAPKATAPTTKSNESTAALYGVPVSALSSPLAQQWVELKKKLSVDTLILLRLGDFYEAFGDDAKIATKILNITLTERNGLPMAGIPFHAIDKTAEQLVAAKVLVAIVDGEKTTVLPATAPATAPAPDAAPARTPAEAAILALGAAGDDVDL